jgi:SPP1 family predicted phage head-tail adaptor
MIVNLRHRVQFKQKTAVSDSQGGESITWPVSRNCWAEVKPLTGESLYYASQVNNEVTHRVTVRYFSGLNATDWIVTFKGRDLEILGVVNQNEEDKWLVLTCREVS